LSCQFEKSLFEVFPAKLFPPLSTFDEHSEISTNIYQIPGEKDAAKS
jgi:hypothetical protein